tara:strand:+ start:131 stop:544 length:414 start_codon:yes stop_codon:yes gene_type:complete
MGRFLGIDFGEKRVGLALSDRSKLIAYPFKTINYFNVEDLVNQLKEIVIDNDIENFILGLPINMKGEDTKQTQKVRSFKNSLSALKVPIIYEDERLSSVSAKNSLILQNIKTGYNKHEIDKTAAAIILQQYLDKHSN